ncbi:MAG: hypothetical protein ACOX6L_05095 [Syntrophomonadaceae bacterium]
MYLKLVKPLQFSPGDLVTVRGMPENQQFCIISIKNNTKQESAVLKALFNETYIIEKPLSELKSLLIKGIL